MEMFIVDPAPCARATSPRHDVLALTSSRSPPQLKPAWPEKLML
jgi:hypothetical protein